MTSVDLKMVSTSSPTLMFNESIEREVMTEVTIPAAVSTSTSDNTGPRMISFTLPLNWFLAFIAIIDITFLHCKIELVFRQFGNEAEHGPGAEAKIVIPLETCLFILITRLHFQFLELVIPNMRRTLTSLSPLQNQE